MVLGIDPDKQRDRMAESLQIIMRLLDGEVVSHKSDWFQMHEARLQLKSFTRPRPHIAVTSTITPNGAKLAGRYGLGMLCVAAAAPAGYNVLDTNWGIANEVAAQHGQKMNPADLRLMAPIHVAETREQAVKEVNWGFEKYLHYSYSLRPEGPVAIGLPTEITMDNIEELHRSGKASIGTPDDAIALIEKFWNKTGGFGSMLILAHDWASFENTKKSFEMFARYVMPKFAGRNTQRENSLTWIRGPARGIRQRQQGRRHAPREGISGAGRQEEKAGGGIDPNGRPQVRTRVAPGRRFAAPALCVRPWAASNSRSSAVTYHKRATPIR